MPPPASPSAQKEEQPGAQGWQAHRTKASPTFCPEVMEGRAPGWGLGACAPVFLGQGLGLASTPAPAPRAEALCTLRLPLSCRTRLPISRHPWTPSSTPSGNLRGTAAGGQALCRALCTSLTRACLGQQLGCGLGPVPEAPHGTPPCPRGRCWEVPREDKAL